MKNSALEKRLRGNGQLIAEAKRAGRSLHSSPDGKVISRVRDEAKAAGYTFSEVSRIEWDGELGTRGVVAQPVEAAFRGLQVIPFLFFRPMRLYDIHGDHPRNNSTVSVMTLVHEHVIITDISYFQVAVEYVNEAMFILFCAVDNKIQSLRAWIAEQKEVARLALGRMLTDVKNLFKGGR